MTEKGYYSIHPAVAYQQAIIDNMPEKTGKSLEQWVRTLKKDGPKGAKERKAWLKSAHKIGGTTASIIVARAEGGPDEMSAPKAYLKAAAAYVEAQYAGPKGAMRPIYERLIEVARALGGDIRICPCKTMVPVYRNHVIAEVKPSTRTRVDFGLSLKGAKKKPPKRLVDTGGLAKGDRITHRIALASVDEIDAEVERWLRVAYELDA
jgi:hypothetical protein